MEPSSHARNKDVCTKLGAVTPEPQELTTQEQRDKALELSLKKQASELVKTKTTELKLALFAAVTPQRFTRIVEKVVERAENGHEKSLNLLFKYFVPKPGDRAEIETGGGSSTPYSININVVAPTAPQITIQQSEPLPSKHKIDKPQYEGRVVEPGEEGGDNGA